MSEESPTLAGVIRACRAALSATNAYLDTQDEGHDKLHEQWVRAADSLEAQLQAPADGKGGQTFSQDLETLFVETVFAQRVTNEILELSEKLAAYRAALLRVAGIVEVHLGTDTPLQQTARELLEVLQEPAENLAAVTSYAAQQQLVFVVQSLRRMSQD